MSDPKETSAPEPEATLGTPQDEDWWKGWRLDEPADSLLVSPDSGTEDWWAGWHAALLREG